MQSINGTYKVAREIIPIIRAQGIPISKFLFQMFKWMFELLKAFVLIEIGTWCNKYNSPFSNFTITQILFENFTKLHGG